MVICECENCGKSFKTEDGEWYDLCDVCVGPYEEALAEAQQEDPDVMRVPFPEQELNCEL